MTGAFSQKHFAVLIQRTLLAGVFLSMALIFGGFALSSAGSAHAGAVIRTGLLVLLLTPAARVVMLIYGYWRGGEYYFALASFVVLSLLGVSLLIG